MRVRIEQRWKYSELLRRVITAKIKFRILLCCLPMQFLIFSRMLLMLRIVFNVFSMMFAKTSLLFCCFCIRLFVMNYVCVVPYGIMRNLDAILRVVRPRHTMRHVAATVCCNKSPRVTCENHCRTNSNWFEFVQQTKGRDTRCDKSLRHVAATGCCNKSPRVTCGKHCRCDRILSLQSVARIQTDLNSYDISQRPNKSKDLSQQQCRRGDLSLRRVTAICRIVCLGLYCVMRNLDAIIRVSHYVRLSPDLQRARPLWSGASDNLFMPILHTERKFMPLSMAEVARKLSSNI